MTFRLFLGCLIEKTMFKNFMNHSIALLFITVHSLKEVTWVENKGCLSKFPFQLFLKGSCAILKIHNYEVEVLIEVNNRQKQSKAGVFNGQSRKTIIGY